MQSCVAQSEPITVSSPWRAAPPRTRTRTAFRELAPRGPCAQPGALSPERRAERCMTQRVASADCARPGRSFALAPARSRYKGGAPRAPLHHSSSRFLQSSFLSEDSSHRSARHGPQLLLRHRWFLHLRRLLQMQRVQMHLLQEELLLLLPRGLRQVCPGMRLQRRSGQVQLLRLSWAEPGFHV